MIRQNILLESMIGLHELANLASPGSPPGRPLLLGPDRQVCGKPSGRDSVSQVGAQSLLATKQYAVLKNLGADGPAGAAAGPSRRQGTPPAGPCTSRWSRLAPCAAKG
jgi:hypothetical protein